MVPRYPAVEIKQRATYILRIAHYYRLRVPVEPGWPGSEECRVYSTPDALVLVVFRYFLLPFALAAPSAIYPRTQGFFAVSSRNSRLTIPVIGRAVGPRPWMSAGRRRLLVFLRARR